MTEILSLQIYTNIAINCHDTCCYLISLLFSCSPYFVFLHFCIFYQCDISCSCVWQLLAFYRNEMNVTIDTGVIVICFVCRLYISECVWHLLLIKKWNEMKCWTTEYYTDHAVKERRRSDVSRLAFPRIQTAVRSHELVPIFTTML